MSFMTFGGRESVFDRFVNELGLELGLQCTVLTFQTAQKMYKA